MYKIFLAFIFVGLISCTKSELNDSNSSNLKLDTIPADSKIIDTISIDTTVIDTISNDTITNDTVTKKIIKF